MLELHDLHKRFGEVVALDGVSLTAQPGRLLGFLGPNGAGKTTSMRAVFDLIQLDSGQVQFDGREVRTEDLAGFGYMPEQRGLYPRMKVLDQLVHFARLHGLSRDTAIERAGQWLARLGIEDRAGDLVNTLSHGNQQRVQLAVALVHDPRLLVLDEPFSGLDPLGVEAMSQVLRDRAEAGTTVVFSSHQLDLVEDLCDDVVVIARGRVRLSGTLTQVRASATHRRLDVRLDAAELQTPAGVEVIDERGGTFRLRVPLDVDPAVLAAELAKQGRIEHFFYSAPSLAEIFKEVAA